MDLANPRPFVACKLTQWEINVGLLTYCKSNQFIILSCNLEEIGGVGREGVGRRGMDLVGGGGGGVGRLSLNYVL